MEETIKTNIAVITDPSKLANIIIKDNFDLVKLLSQKINLSIYEMKLPLQGYFKDEDAEYIGAFDSSTGRFVGSKATGNTVFVIKGVKSKKIVNLDKTGLNKAILDYLDLEKLSSYYDMYFNDLPVTKLVYGLYNTKIKLAGNLIAYNFDYQTIYSLDKKEDFFITIEIDGDKNKQGESKLKLNIRDCEFVAKFNLKGYNLPKDRTINIGDDVSFKYKGEVRQGVIADIRDKSGFYQDNKGKTVKNFQYFVSFNGLLLRFKKSQIKKVK